jgi:hypothetical protein
MNKMKRQMQLLFVFLITLLVCSSTHATPAVKSNPAIKSGEYLKSDYISMIEKTHSPYAALTSSKEPILLVAYKGEYDLVLIHYFHEFDDGLNIRDDGKACRIGTDGKDPSAESFTVDGDNLTFTDYNSHGPLHYVYVGNAERFVARKVIIGDYVDAVGKTYSFREDGTAQFGDVQFPYEIGLDFVLRPNSGKNNSKRDYFQNSKSRELFEYEIKDGVMSIYRTSGAEAMDVETEPFLKIKKVNR